jgi:hypothetical protein
VNAAVSKQPKNQLKLTHEEKLIRNAFVSEASTRHPGDFTAAMREGVAAFHAHRGRPRAATETSGQRAPKLDKRASRIVAKAVSEALTAALAPTPPPAAAPAPAAKAPAAGLPLHELDADAIAAAATQRLGAGNVSPFWRRENATVAQVAESEAAARPDVPLHTMDTDQFADHVAAAFGAYGRASGFGSPVWQG